MRSFIIILLLTCSFTGLTQIKGKGELKTVRATHESIAAVDISLYANIEIDANSPETYAEITAEEDLLDFIQFEVKNKTLIINQKEWIQPSKQISITIGAPDLKKLVQGTHEKVIVRNLDTNEFTAIADVGEIQLFGTTQNLTAQVNTGTVNAENLKADDVQVKTKSWGSIKLDRPKKITGSVSNNGTVSYKGEETKVTASTSDNGVIRDLNKDSALDTDEEFDTRFIKFELKNNSNSRKHYYVIGPKPDGKRFSYGFPMNAGQIREKDWTIGTKLYQQSKFGVKKLVLEIQEDDEGQLVLIYPEK